MRFFKTAALFGLTVTTCALALPERRAFTDEVLDVVGTAGLPHLHIGLLHSILTSSQMTITSPYNSTHPAQGASSARLMLWYARQILIVTTPC
jgi:hypothetical protein